MRAEAAERLAAARLPALPYRSALASHAVQLAVVLSVAFTLRLAWVLISQWEPQFDDDAFRYDFAARALANGDGYIHLTGDPTAFWPPGYSLLLSTLYVLFGQHVIAAQMLNVVLGTATVAIVYLLGRTMTTRMGALIAAGAVALWPSLIFLTGVTLSETAFTFFALAAVLLVVRTTRVESTTAWRLLLAAGCVLGFAALVRGQALLLPLVFVPFWLRSGMQWRQVGRMIAIIAIGMAAFVVPWTVRNAIELDAPVLISTNAGVDFWIGHHEDAGGDFGATGGDELVFRHPELSSIEREVKVNNEGFREGLEYAVTHPLEELLLPFKKLFWLYYNDEEGLKWNEGHGSQEFLPGPVREAFLALSNVYYFAVLGVVALGMRRWSSLWPPGPVLLVSLFGYWTLVHLVFFGDPRFHAPILPVVALLAGLTWTGQLRDRARHN
jgi:4-amino-4-deoxy-L-arabinose transferase-like glycosyltransferase